MLRKLIDFADLYRLYRRGGNTRRCSARIAYGCAFRALPF